MNSTNKQPLIPIPIAEIDGRTWHAKFLNFLYYRLIQELCQRPTWLEPAAITNCCWLELRLAILTKQRIAGVLTPSQIDEDLSIRSTIQRILDDLGLRGSHSIDW